MRENLNIFTKVQVAAPDYPGVPIGDAEYQRVGGIYHSTFMGRFGDAQIGPIYLGATGIASQPNTGLVSLRFGMAGGFSLLASSLLRP